MKKKAIVLSITLLLSASMAHAHSVWINAFESHAHQSRHAMVSLGWGHALPMDDILTSPNGRIAIEQFELLDPALKKTDLIKPEFKLSKPEMETGNFDLFARPTFYTQYVDKGGKTRMQLKPKNELNDIKKVLMAVKYQAFAKSYLTVGTWANPNPLGHGLEIIPRTDLSDLHVGDLVEVDVRFYGEPLTATAKSIEYITAQSSSFGQSDGFSLMSYIMEGRAQFRVQSRGQWMIGVNHKDDVTADGPLKDLYGKAEQVYHSASLTFTVK
jgi:uncharacterized GH25 family protein